MEKPKIRFKGYQEDWEQRKLGELGSLKNGMNFSKEAMELDIHLLIFKIYLVTTLLMCQI